MPFLNSRGRACIWLVPRSNSVRQDQVLKSSGRAVIWLSRRLTQVRLGACVKMCRGTLPMLLCSMMRDWTVARSSGWVMGKTEKLFLESCTCVTLGRQPYKCS